MHQRKNRSNASRGEKACLMRAATALMAGNFGGWGPSNTKTLLKPHHEMLAT